MNDRSGSVPFSEEVVMLVAVVQVSSAAVERVFSQLTFIQRAVGDRTLRDMMELKAYICCNNELGNDLKIVEGSYHISHGGIHLQQVFGHDLLALTRLTKQFRIFLSKPIKMEPNKVQNICG